MECQFALGDFPDTKGLYFGQVIQQSCWKSAYTSFGAILDALEEEGDQIKTLQRSS